MKGNCKTCEGREACEWAFGKYWKDRSRNGEGCNAPWEETRERSGTARPSLPEGLGETSLPGCAKQERFL